MLSSVGALGLNTVMSMNCDGRQPLHSLSGLFGTRHAAITQLTSAPRLLAVAGARPVVATESDADRCYREAGYATVLCGSALDQSSQPFAIGDGG